MSLRIQRSEWFIGDLEHYAAWYDREANWDLAERYLNAVTTSLVKLAEHPALGHPIHFDALELRGIHIFAVKRPFQKHLIFYRFDEAAIYAERTVHGTRDLPRRLSEPPGAAD